MDLNFRFECTSISFDIFVGFDGSIPQEVNKVTLFKDPIFEDFGFSLSDGLYERGISVARIKPGGPADGSGLLRPFDRILQINNTRTTDFDCCLAVPLIAAAGDKMDLLVNKTNPTKLRQIHNVIYPVGDSYVPRGGGA